MQFSVLVLAAIATFSTAALGCSASQGCCWGGDDGQGCYNQHGLTSVTKCGGYKSDFCSNRSDGKNCGADCCSTSTGWGIACP